MQRSAPPPKGRFVFYDWGMKWLTAYMTFMAIGIGMTVLVGGTFLQAHVLGVHNLITYEKR